MTASPATSTSPAPTPATDHAAGSSGQATALLQRLILPRPGDPLTLRSLYVDEDTSNRRRSRPLGRTSVVLPREGEVSFATYFNAFPASYWRRWSTLDTVVLRLEIEGRGRVDLYRSKADATQIHLGGEVVDGDRVTLELPVDLSPFEDGGWVWFDVTTGDEEVTVHSAGWYATREPAAPAREGSVAVAITTFNRPGDCVAALAALAEDPLVLEAVGAVTVADQGTKKIVDDPGYAAAAAALGDRLRVREQANLGGSGGFSRGMLEMLEGTDCDHVLLCDDDVVLEPDSVLRALAFARFGERPMIVGAQMLNLQARSHLHSMGEVVDRTNFTWRPAPGVENDHDFAEDSLRETEWLHRRIDVDYNGWWMSLIPRSAVEQLGLSLPVFIKWDDTEYSLRATQVGVPTVTLPGMAIWHMPWTDKDDATDWQAYFHLRNRLIVAALHSPYRRGGSLVSHSLKSALKHLLSLEYSTVALHLQAMEDFLAGPAVLADRLPTALGEVRKKRAGYTDGTVLESSRSLPLPSMDAVKAERFLKPPANPVTIGATLAAGLVHNVLPVNAEHHTQPQLNVPFQDARWFLLARLDGATVGTADGRGVTFRKRDPRTFWALLGASLRSHAELRQEFPRMRKEYRAGLDEMTSPRSWRRVFGLDER